MNTYFYAVMCHEVPSGQLINYVSVRRWCRRNGKKVNIFNQRLFIVPIHLGIHWTCACVFMKQQRICYYDSQGGEGKTEMAKVKAYLANEWLANYTTAFDPRAWDLTCVHMQVDWLNGLL